jgi:NADH dehydrogenase (ubiquinone) Fe-S protein 1
VGVKLPYDTLNEVRDRLTDVCPSMTRYGDLEQANYLAQAADLAKVTKYILYFNIIFI